MNEDEDFSFEVDPENSFIDEQKLVELWSKIEVANMMIARANGILSQAATDLKFYNMVTDYNGEVK
jgi:hypothetical protein